MINNNINNYNNIMQNEINTINQMNNIYNMIGMNQINVNTKLIRLYKEFVLCTKDIYLADFICNLN